MTRGWRQVFASSPLKTTMREATSATVFIPPFLVEEHENRAAGEALRAVREAERACHEAETRFVTATAETRHAAFEAQQQAHLRLILAKRRFEELKRRAW